MINGKKKNNSLYIICICLFFAIFIRAYNINYDNFWFDEILSYWITNPEISFKESLDRHKDVEVIPFFFHFLLKISFKLSSYEPDFGRYLSLLFNVLGIIFSTLLCKKIQNNSAYLLALFLFSTNIFLISYSQELRPYSLIFFLCSLNLYLFFKIQKSKKYQNFNFFYFLLIIVSQISMIISHPFNFIIFFSTILYVILNFICKKKNSKTLIYSFCFSGIFSLSYLIFFLQNIDTFPSWIVQPDLKFYTNFYFSKFFGSRLMGIVHLVLLLTLIAYFLEKFTKENFNLNMFIIIIFLSYFLPLTYGYLLKPIIFPRYIIFVLIPIIILISILTFQIKNKIIRDSIIFLIVLLNIGNHFTETTFKQFYEERPFYKTNFEKMIYTLNQNEVKSYTIEMSTPKEMRQGIYRSINNYISSFKDYKSSQIVYIKKEVFLKSKKNKIWLVCLPDVVIDKCNYNLLSPLYKVLDQKNLPGIKLSLIEKTK